jgi:hypothetical protein
MISPLKTYKILDQSTMEMPIFRAVPLTIFIALLILVVFKSGNFIFAISSNCALVTEPTLIRFGVDEPFLTFAAFANKIDAGGVLRIKV